MHTSIRHVIRFSTSSTTVVDAAVKKRGQHLMIQEVLQALASLDPLLREVLPSLELLSSIDPLLFPKEIRPISVVGSWDPTVPMSEIW